MAHLVDDLLDLRGIEDQTARPVLDYHALAPIVAEAVTLVTPLAHERHERRPVASCVGMPSISCGRARSCGRYNLLSNAVKYTEPGGHVTLSAQRTAPDLVEVAVSDDGIGIAPQGLPKIACLLHPGRRQAAAPRPGRRQLGLAR
ncbi:MAG: ATP-binding protein [Myxococcota bacterium]